MDSFNESSSTRRQLEQEVSRRLSQSGSEMARKEAAWLLEYGLRLNPLEMLMRPEEMVDSVSVEAVLELVRRRELGEPLQYITGFAPFFGFEFSVTPAVLIPRPETELLVEWALKEIGGVGPKKVLDIGTGSGCIAVSVALKCLESGTEDVDVVAVDVSAGALEVARSNAIRLGASVAFRELDMLDEDAEQRLGDAFDILISNPPYISTQERESLQPEVRDHEPELALFAGRDPLLFYRALCTLARKVLRAGGAVGVEVHADHGQQVVALFSDSGFEFVQLDQDLAGRDRLVSARVPGGSSSQGSRSSIDMK